MSSEYVKISREEILYGKKNFLKAQLDVLGIIKRYLTYQKLRKEEFLLKIELKNKVEETRNSILMFERGMPRTYPAENDKKKKIQLEKESEQEISLEKEIELIREKLIRLR